MKLTALLIFCFSLVTVAEGVSQNVSFSGKNVSLKTVFSSVEKQTGFVFLYVKSILNIAQPVSIKAENVALNQFLSDIFLEQPLEFEIRDKNVFVTLKPVARSSDRQLKSNGTFDFLKDSIKPGDEIRGRVTNEQGEPLAGANVMIKRTGTGTVTNANGLFLLKNANNDDILIVSFIGYSSLSIKVGNSKALMAIMRIATNTLDEAVVQAYGKTTNRLRTGNIGKITSEDISKQPLMNPLQILQGQVAGAVVTNASGYASGTVKVEIRGRNTINPNFPSDPLYIIDGVPLTILNVNSANSNYQQGSQGAIQSGIVSPAIGQSPLFSLSPSDIESIEVLKDADATAIYGSRASNGVILITTKKGKPGKTHGDVSVTTGYSEVPRQYKMLTTEQYIQIRKEAIKNDNLSLTNTTAPDLILWDTSRYTNWQDFIWGRRGQTFNSQASISGGDARTSFRASGSYAYQRDILAVKGGNYRGSLSLNLNHHSLDQKFSFLWNTVYSNSKIELVQMPSGAVYLPPNAPAVYDALNNLNYTGWNPISNKFSFGVLKQPYTSKSNWINSNINLAYELLKGLVIKTSFGYNNAQTEQVNITPIAAQNPTFNPKGTLNLGYTNFHNLIIEPQIEYSRFISRGRLSILLGGTTQENITDGVTNSGTNYTNDVLLTSINNAPNKSVVNFNGEYKYAAIFGRINYDWNNKYILNLNVRRDGSSKFGPGKQFGNFGSIGGAWIFSEENFSKRKLRFLSFGKLRGSYGIVGGDQIGDYGYLSLWQFGGGTGNYNSYVPLNPVGPSDSMLQWQVNKKLELAASFSFLNDQISFEVSWYRNRCKNQLVSFPLPAFTGFTSVTSNSPASVENTGWEFVGNGKIIYNEKIKLTAKLNIGINRNRLRAYPNFSQSPYANTLAIGKPLNIARYLHSTGVDPQNGKYTFEDINSDTIISINPGISDDRLIYNLTPKYDGGFTIDFSYKNWSISTFCYFKKQLGRSALTSTGIPGTTNNQPVSVLNRWQKVGDKTSVGKLSTISSSNVNNYFYYSDANLVDASFVRLQNVMLSYELIRQLKNKLKVNSCKIYLQGQNLFLLTNYIGIDPEVQNFGGLPRPRIITAGLSCNF